MPSKYLVAIFLALPLILVTPNITFAGQTCVWDFFDQEANPGGTPTCPDGMKLSESDKNCKDPEPPTPLLLQGRNFCCCEHTESVYAPVNPINPELSTPLPKFNLSLLETKSGSFEIPWIGEYIIALYNYGVSIASLAASVMLMAAGLLWLTAGGNDERIDKAKRIMAGSIIGIFIIFSTNLILFQINPALVTFNPIKMIFLKRKTIEANDPILKLEHTKKKEIFASAPCATEEELENGVEFFSTGYYKPEYEDNREFFCAVGLNCLCPNGDNRDKTQGVCSGGNYPCAHFDQNTSYCEKTSSNTKPKVGTIAGPINCKDSLPPGTQVCYAGQTFTITDTGGGIRGKRIDIFSRNLERAGENTGHAILKIGRCE